MSMLFIIPFRHVHARHDSRGSWFRAEEGIKHTLRYYARASW